MTLEHSDDDEVLTIPQWAKLNTFSLSTAYRILNGPKDQRPEITQLSDKRIGITRGANRRWLKKRAR
jgi:hypothetical protein